MKRATLLTKTGWTKTAWTIAGWSAVSVAVLALLVIAALFWWRPTGPQLSRYHVSLVTGKARPAYALPVIQSPQNVADPRNLPLVVVDAGHGGHDPGSISPATGMQEKRITLAMAQEIARALLASGKVRVALTRNDDRYLVLEERYGIARKLGANLFISVHADSAENRDATGASIYTLSDVASDREAAKFAARENRANLINGIDLGDESKAVGNILIDLTQRETMDISTDFAKLLQREAAGSGVKFRTGAHHFAGFVVLKAPDVPSVLLETGYISNVDDEAVLVSEAGRQRMANGVARAVAIHFAKQGL